MAAGSCFQSALSYFSFQECLMIQLYILGVTRTTGFLPIVMLALLLWGDQHVSFWKCIREALFRYHVIYY
jgi:hypothetical protein